jgi:putative drug exporter of the RND superfamily
LRRPILVSLIWLVALAGGLALAPRLASVAVTDPLEFFPRDSRTRTADAALAEWFPAARAPSQIVVVLEAEGDGPIFPAARERIRALAARLRAELPADALNAVLSPADDPVLAQRLVAGDGRAALIVLRLSLGFASERASAVVAQAEEITASELAEQHELRAALTGEATLGRDYLAAIEEGGRHSGLATIALVAMTLLAVYRAPLAALVSLVTLGVALGVAIGAVTFAAQLGLPVAYQSRGFLVALLFGIGTDYCLLLFARVRESARDPAAEDPVGAALRTTTPVIATSAAAVAVACALMALARFGLFRDSGPALAIATAVALAAILTLTPELLRLPRAALFWPGTAASSEPTRRFWAAIGRRVVRSPLTVLVVFGVPLVPLAWVGLRLTPSFELELDIPEGSASERGWQALTRHFDPAAISPLIAAVALPDDSPRSLRAVDGLDALYQLSRTLAAEPGVGAVWSATQPTGDPALLARGTLASQLDALHEGLGQASVGARALASGLGNAEGQVGAGRSELAAKRAELDEERRASLLAALAPGRFDAAARDLDSTREKLGTLESGIGRAARGANQLADGVALGAGRLEALRGEPGAGRVLDHLALTQSDIASTPDLARALDHYVTRDGRAALFELRLASAPNSPAAVELCERLRAQIPVWLAGFGVREATVWLAGATAITAELTALTRADLDRLGLWILLGVFVLLVALLRGVAAPLCVTAFILASYFAALGGLELLVRCGAWPGVDWKAPFFLFVLLVAIGADYGVFVLGRAREEARALPYTAAIARALEATGPVVTSCGVVLAGTFATLLLSRIAFLEQVGIGVTIGVLIDTLIVRPFLLPAAALLLAGEGSPTFSAGVRRTK